MQWGIFASLPFDKFRNQIGLTPKADRITSGLRSGISRNATNLDEVTAARQR